MRARNDRIAAAAKRLHFGRDAPVPFLCECGDHTCEELVRMTVEGYDAVHADVDHFTAPGHRIDRARIVRVRDGAWLHRAC